MKIKELIKNHQQKIALLVGYLFVAILGVGIGRITAYKYSAPEIKIENAFTLPSNSNSNTGTVQSASVDNCEGKIKGNINSKGEKIYHLPAGSFYERTNPEQCFNNEQEAINAGFRRSSR